MYILIGLGVVFVLVVLFLATYKVVDPNEAHIVVKFGSGRKLYAPKSQDAEGKEIPSKTSYFFIPRLMTREILPLTNVKMNIPEIHLNDIEVAPFVCDVIAWIHVDNPIIAAERLNVNHPEGTFGSLGEDLKGIVHAVAREVAMRQEILQILRDRKTFSESVSKAVDGVLKSWGVELINLEVIDIKDDASKTSRVIADYESIRKVKVNTEARKENSGRDREAVVVEQENREAAEIATAEAEENLRKRQISKDKEIGISEQQQATEVARAAEIANEQRVSAEKTLQVGLAAVTKEATIEEALGQGEAVKIKGEKEAEVITLTGKAQGSAIEAKGLADAVSKDKMAEAMKKFNDAATNIEKINAWKTVEMSKYSALGDALSKADLKLVSSGKGGNLFGFPLNAETGADLGQMSEAMGGGNNPIQGIGDSIKSVLNNLVGSNKEAPKGQQDNS